MLIPILLIRSSGDFFWLSAPKPIVPPATPFPAGFTDVQAWISNEDLAPGWLRIGTDIVVGSPTPTCNATFSLAGQTGPETTSLTMWPGSGRCISRGPGATPGPRHPALNSPRVGRNCSVQVASTRGARGVSPIPFYGRHRMFLWSWFHVVKRTLPASRQVGRRPRSPRLHCEELELRLQPSAFAFNTGIPDGKVATITEPANAHNSQVEYESADDFVVGTETKIRHASFTGLLTGGATPRDLKNVVVEIYRVFPNDSDVGRTSGPPVFSTPHVPTRVN